MSDERFKREPGEDAEPYAPRVYGRVRPTFQDVKPVTVTADEMETWLVKFCEKLGIKRDPQKRGKP